MQDFLTWGSLVLAGGSVVAWIKFWMDMGGQQQKVDQAHSIGASAAAKADLIMSQLNEHKIDTAKKFSDELRAAEIRSSSAVDAIRAEFRSAVEGIRHDMRDMAGRLDKLIVGLLKREE